MPQPYDIMIIGAGAAGLMAARELSAAGKKVLMLEARHRPGGRIETLTRNGFTQPVEAGPEFIHGNLPLTLQLCRQYRLSYTKVAGAMLRKKNGMLQQDEQQVEGWNGLMDKMSALLQDMTLNEFLTTHFAGEEYNELRLSVQQYAAGFDLADPQDVSVFSLRNEWQHEEEDMYRITGGYETLVDALLNECVHFNTTVHFDTIAKTIEWQQGSVQVTTTTNEVFKAVKIIITVPVSLLQNPQESAGSLVFVPAIPAALQQARQIGFGSIIKVMLQFTTAFWKEVDKKALFFFSEEAIPTWWTQHPSDYSLLTGWLGGPKASAMAGESNEAILQKALQSLAAIFTKKPGELQQQLTAWHVANWQQDAFARGGYSYEKVAAAAAKKQLFIPIQNTIYFAGEALYAGNAQSTVEAALITGKAVAAIITKS